MKIKYDDQDDILYVEFSNKPIVNRTSLRLAMLQNKAFFTGHQSIGGPHLPAGIELVGHFGSQGEGPLNRL